MYSTRRRDSSSAQMPSRKWSTEKCWVGFVLVTRPCLTPSSWKVGRVITYLNSAKCHWETVVGLAHKRATSSQRSSGKCDLCVWKATDKFHQHQSVSWVVFCIRNKMGFFVVVKNQANFMDKVGATYTLKKLKTVFNGSSSQISFHSAASTQKFTPVQWDFACTAIFLHIYEYILTCNVSLHSDSCMPTSVVWFDLQCFISFVVYL